MIFVKHNDINTLSYFSRYDQINKYEILDHTTSIVFTGLTNINAIDGEITHSGLTYVFGEDCLYTYRSYYISGSTELLANQSYLTTISDDSRYNSFIIVKKPDNSFKVFSIGAIHLQWGDGFMYNETLLYNEKVW